jgi:hypothetical protein
MYLSKLKAERQKNERKTIKLYNTRNKIRRRWKYKNTTKDAGSCVLDLT